LEVGEARLTEAHGVGPALAKKIIDACKAQAKDIYGIDALVTAVDGLGYYNVTDLWERAMAASRYLNKAYNDKALAEFKAKEKASVGTTKAFGVLVDGKVKAVAVAMQMTAPVLVVKTRAGEEDVEYADDQGRDRLNLWDEAHTRCAEYARQFKGAVVTALDLDTARDAAKSGAHYAVYSHA